MNIIAGDGVYSYKTSEGSIILDDLVLNTSRILVQGKEVVDVSVFRSFLSCFACFLAFVLS